MFEGGAAKAVLINSRRRVGR